MPEKTKKFDQLDSFRLFSDIELDEDLQEELQKIKLRQGYNNYEVVGKTLGLINRLVKEIQELRNNERQGSD